MENAQRLFEVHEADVDRDGVSAQPRTDSFHQGRGVPADWFLDPADPDAGRRLQAGTSLEEQATAFLAEHDAAEDADGAPDTSVTGQTDATVTALHPGTSPRDAPATEPSNAGNVWLGLPGLADPMDVEGELAWQVDALCAQTDPEAFFPEKGGSTRDAKKVCASCTVRSECLEYALGNDERFGIWGGLSERERRRLRKRSV